jgi:hypothetical protein
MSGVYRKAAAAYVRGHDRVWGLAQMRGDSTETESVLEWSGPPVTPRFGVGVATSLDFRRGPGNLRGGAEGDRTRSDD